MATPGKKKRAKPWDRLKEPYVRAHMEVAKMYGLEEGSTERMAHMILWDCRGLWVRVDEWFNSPKLDNARSYWDRIEQYIKDPENGEFLQDLMFSTQELYDKYTESENTVH